ncbi:hydroxypyruvate isomerase family protein [Mucilaginibacter gotjawali]|uniref:Hydroxypyruvate isomerase n=2 Tax=Mucilaginibacter gotjawali TaxID=1550579 RepID=A0A120MZ36_9SPHI|nr:TIM barrel protein [Mucilaginibacter gotjawali]MBB3056417.1 hydroxypyruvate isomerase [Mucilaginibacter gotjawali]BAU55123.1 Hydroxypyruvate isomerase [Mucilaginibacter gotjawali]
MAFNQNRRSAIRNIVAGTAAITASGMLTSFKKEEIKEKLSYKLKGNINHSVSPWCYSELTLDQLCEVCKEIGITGVDLCGPKDWPILQKHGLYSSMCNGAEINLTDAFGDKQFHATLQKNYTEMIPLVEKNGYKNLICFSGSRRGKDNETGWNNCVEGLKPLVALAEKHNVVLCMELLNSKVDHKDYQCNSVEWGVELAKRIGSENFKLLFDIYHMQIMEGDIVRNVTDYHQYIAHYHTGGIPGRHEIDDTQELHYPAVMRAIVATGYKGYVGQEFVPKNTDKIASLKAAIQICDV